MRKNKTFRPQTALRPANCFLFHILEYKHMKLNGLARYPLIDSLSNQYFGMAIGGGMGWGYAAAPFTLSQIICTTRFELSAAPSIHALMWLTPSPAR